MLLGVHCANLTWPGGPASLGTTLAGVARAADDGGVTTVTLMDHYFQMEQLGGPPRPMLEGYTSLGFLAGQTNDVELGLLVTGVTYRACWPRSSRPSTSSAVGGRCSASGQPGTTAST